MILLFTLIHFIKTSKFETQYDVEVNLSQRNLYLILTDDFFEIQERLNLKSQSIFKEKYQNMNKHMNLGVYSSGIQENKMKIFFSNSKPVSFSMKITNLNPNKSQLEVSFNTDILTTTNPVSLTFDVDQPDFLKFSNIDARTNLKIITIYNEEIINQILPQSEQNKVLICYNGITCSKQHNFSIQSDVNYLTLINDNNFKEILNKFIINTKTKYLRIYFATIETPSIDFSMLPIESIEKVEIIGHSPQQPQRIKIADKFSAKIETKNVQFLNPNSKSSHVKTLLANDQISYEISPDFTKNGYITFEISEYSIDVKDQSGNSIEDRFYLAKNFATVFQIKGQIPDGKTIIISHDSTFKRIYSHDILFEFENNGQLNIQFSDWKNVELDEELKIINFSFYSKKDNLNFVSSNNRHIKYFHYDINDKTQLFKQYPTDYVLCMESTTCDPQEYNDIDPVVIENADINNFGTYFDYISKGNLTSLIFFLNNNKAIDINFDCIDESKLKQIKFIGNEVNTIVNILNLQPNINDWVLKNCSINIVTSSYTINNLVSYCSSITPESIEIMHGTYFIEKELKDKDEDINNDIVINIKSQNFDITGEIQKPRLSDSITLKFYKKLENKNNDNTCSVVFKQDESFSPNTKVNLNFESLERIPIKFQDINDRMSIFINVPTKESLVFMDIPQNIELSVYSKQLNRNIQQIKQSASKLAICYDSDSCATQDNFLIEKDSTFITAINDLNLDEIINCINESRKIYNNLRLYFTSDIVNLKIESINNLSAKFKYKIELYGNNNNANCIVKLEDKADTTIFKDWTVHRVTFANDENKFNFSELTIIDTAPVFKNPASMNIHIKSAKFHCLEGYSVDGLSNVDNVEMTTYELFPELDTSDYVLSVRGFTFIANSNLDNGNGNPIIQPSQESFKFFVHRPAKAITKTFYICRFDTVFTQALIKFEDINNDHYNVEYVCKPGQSDKYFKYSFEINDAKYLNYDEGQCKNVNNVINGIDIYPTKSDTFTHSNDFTLSNTFTKSSTFTPSGDFTNSVQFSESSDFSLSSLFSRSSYFSKSSPFTKTERFTETYMFSVSSRFTKSDSFSASGYHPSLGFTETVNFTESSLFTMSQDFSTSFHFTPSFPFQPNQPSLPPTVPPKKDDSVLFNFTSDGFENEYSNKQNLNRYRDPFVTIEFSKPKINITESENFSLNTNLYFVASQKWSSIRVDLKNSTVGIKADKNPTVILADENTPLNIMNCQRGYSTMNIRCEKEEEEKENIVLREVNNSNGYLTLYAEPGIRSISFTSLLMSRLSSFEIRTLEERSRSLLLEENIDENTAQIIVENDIKINRNSEVTLTKVFLKGRLNVYDDSLLTFKGETTFSNDSIIDINFQKSTKTRSQPIIKFNGLLDSTPSKIILNFDKKAKSKKISDFVLVEGSSFRTCLLWSENLSLASNDKRKFESRCEYVEGGLTHFIISVEKGGLSTGAIIGIVIACVALIAIIVIVVVLVLKRKKKKPNNPLVIPIEDSDLEDESTF